MWIELYPDYSTFREIQYDQGLKNGYLKEYDSRGNLKKIEKYIDDILQVDAVELTKVEVRKSYYQNGRVQKTGSFSKDQPVGMHISFDSSGVATDAEMFEKGHLTARGRLDELRRKQGPWKEFYATGELRAEGNYENDKKVGVWKYLYIDGKLEQNGSYVNGKPNGTWKWYYENGSLLREESYLSGKEDGFSYEYFENGDTLSRGEFLDGEREGPWFFKDGDQRIFGNFASGKMTGIWKHFYEDGTLSYTGTYSSGIPEGKHQSWYSDGVLKWTGKYENGKRQGNWVRYFPDGLPVLTIFYDQGIERNYDGIKVFPDFEPADYENLIQINSYIY